MMKKYPKPRAFNEIKEAFWLLIRDSEKPLKKLQMKCNDDMDKKLIWLNFVPNITLNIRRNKFK